MQQKVAAERAATQQLLCCVLVSILGAWGLRLWGGGSPVIPQNVARSAAVTVSAWSFDALLLLCLQVATSAAATVVTVSARCSLLLALLCCALCQLQRAPHSGSRSPLLNGSRLVSRLIISTTVLFHTPPAAQARALYLPALRLLIRMSHFTQMARHGP